MTKLFTAAWVAHNLGLGACFGATLFGKFALNPSVEAISRSPNVARSSVMPGTATARSTPPRLAPRPVPGSSAGSGFRVAR